ncbi:MAG: M14 family metallopeptidase [Gemmatimonadota bacterium]
MKPGGLWKGFRAGVARALRICPVCIAVGPVLGPPLGPARLAGQVDAASAQAAPLIAFDHYHTLTEIRLYLQRVTLQHEKLATLVEFGRSRAGRPLLAVEIHNPDTGPAAEKPGFYLDGNIHGGEVLGGEAALYFIDSLLEGYGTDPRITELVDRYAFYVVAIVNPDGRAISVDTPENHRWNIRPVDEDGDGLVDEDPPEDLDGDGRILRMRVPDPAGPWRISPDDPRRMVRADSASARRYRLYTEGIDDDGDGRFNEDRVGGVDLNRNFPSNWSPAQFASGPYPLSEPETRALVEYITSRPNIAAIHTYHTSGGLLLRFPTLADQNWDYPQADLEDYRAIAEDGVRLTGYRNFAYEKKPIVDLMSPGHGVFNDWGSKVFGVLAMTTEMWAHGFGQGPRAVSEWNDRVLGGRGFADWYPFQHPQLGKVELGGWDRWSLASPPEPMIAAELERNNRWVLTFAEKLPRIAILSLSAAPAPKAGGASGEAADGSAAPGGGRTLEIRARVANLGWMPTATAYAATVLKTARPVRARLTLRGARLVQGEPTRNLGVLPGARGDGPTVLELVWRVRPEDPGRPAEAELVVSSEKAGTARKKVRLNAGS